MSHPCGNMWLYSTRQYEIQSYDADGMLIWRRVQVRSEITLAQLHKVIQIAMGWADSHLHQFTVYGQTFGRPDIDGLEEVHDEKRAALWRLVGLRDSFVYEYDFGDDWEHQVVVEKALPVEEGVGKNFDGRWFL